MVGPGRGSAAGSLVSYVIGITNVDPIEYNLLFERFLNPERVTMPDIDVDFEDARRDEVIEYVKERYGRNNVAQVMTYGTLGPRQVLNDVARYFNLMENINLLTKVVDIKLSLKDCLKLDKVNNILKRYPEIKKVYKYALKLEGIKRQVSTTAAGIAICDREMDEIIPVCYSDNVMLAGLTLAYLEDMGILKMDFLGISNLTVIHNILDLVDEKINLNNISLDDDRVYDLFSNADTAGIFQFESIGMRNFLKKLKPRVFSDLYAGLALFRPGPMGNIDEFIARKEGKKKIDYIDNSLKDILEETYGIIVYQEQIMLILVRMANYSFAEADNIRRAMSKKKEDIIISEKERFISRAIKNGYSRSVVEDTYAKILKFAEYGFNKAHSVSYAMIGYKQAYLKVNYPEFFIANLLNMNIHNEGKTSEYLQIAKSKDIVLKKPSVNLSQKGYIIEDKGLRLPMSVIKNVGDVAENDILEKRKNGDYLDFYDFVGRVDSRIVNKQTLEYLIKAGALDDFKISRKTMIDNLDNALRYRELLANLDASFIEKPILEESDEYDKNELVKQELSSYGFYISNHPASKYQGKDIVKLSKVEEYFDKYLKCVVIIDSIRIIKTKKGDNMAFLSCSDETKSFDFVMFASGMAMLSDISKNDLVEIIGKVTRRLNDYQINISKIVKRG